MKRLFLLTACAALLAACSTENYGSVDAAAIQEVLKAPKMAVTPDNPGWLLEAKDIHPLSDVELKQVRELLSMAEVRRVAERYYRSADQGNRGDTTDKVFYLYASNAQCLGGRVFPGRVMMDDFNMTEEAQQELYGILQPKLEKLYGSKLP